MTTELSKVYEPRKVEKEIYNRWIDSTGVHALSDEAHREGGKRSARTGYAR